MAQEDNVEAEMQELLLLQIQQQQQAELELMERI